MEQSAAFGEIPQPPISEETLQIKQLRRQGNILGGALLIYKGIMNVAVYAVMLAAALVQMLSLLLLRAFGSVEEGRTDYDQMLQAMTDASGWGYFLAIVIGIGVLLLWKKPSYFSMTILQRGKSMTAGSFFALVCLIFGCQLPTQLLAYGIEWVSNLLGGSFMDVLAQNTVDTSTPLMWLYVCFGAPIAEELLFRGLLLRTLEPYSKKFAVVTTAVLFGLYHGSPVQTPFAILVGLILGYVAIEHDVVWAIVLHVMNNLLMSDLLPRMLACLPYDLAGVLLWVILAAFFLVALVILLEKCRHSGLMWWEPPMKSGQKRAFWCSPCIIILTIWCLFDLSMYFLLMFL